MKAMIFAAGLGTRLKPLTNTMPKALVPILKKPLLEHVIEKLKGAAPSTQPKSSTSIGAEAAQFRNLLSASGFFSLLSRVGAEGKQPSGGDPLARLVQSLLSFAARPSVSASSSPLPASPLRALIALALEAKGLLPLVGHSTLLAYRSFARSFALGGAARSRSPSKPHSSSGAADESDPGLAMREGSRLLDILDGLVAGLLGSFSGDRSPDNRQEEKEKGDNTADDEEEEVTASSESGLTPLAALDRFNRTPLPDGKRWLILPFESVDTQGELAAVFRVLVDRPGPDGREPVLSLAAEIRASERIWSLRLPRALSKGAPLLIACDDAAILREPSCASAARALAAAWGLVPVFQEGEAGMWPDEWAQGLASTDVMV